MDSGFAPLARPGMTAEFCAAVGSQLSCRHASRKNVRDDPCVPADVLDLGLLSYLRALAGLRYEGLGRGDLAVLRRVAAADLHGVVGLDHAPAGVGVARREGAALHQLAADHHGG